MSKALVAYFSASGVTAGSYEFKVHDAGTDKWYGKNDTEINDSVNRLTMSATGGNCTFVAAGGVYEFKYELSTNKLSVFYAAQEIIGDPTEAPAAYIIGDADNNGEVDILDATCIQRYLASYTVLSFDPIAANVTGGGVNIMDATAIQRYLASYSDPYHIGETVTK